MNINQSKYKVLRSIPSVARQVNYEGCMNQYQPPCLPHFSPRPPHFSQPQHRHRFEINQNIKALTVLRGLLLGLRIYNVRFYQVFKEYRQVLVLRKG